MFLIGIHSFVSAQNTNSLNSSKESEKQEVPKQVKAPVSPQGNGVSSKKTEAGYTIQKNSSSATDGDVSSSSETAALQATQACQLSYNNIRKQDNSRSPSAKQLALIQKNVSILKQTAPNSAAYHFFTYFTHRFDEKYASHLLNAVQQNPFDETMQDELFAFHLANGNFKQVDSLTAIHSTSVGLTNYYTDAVAALPQQATLVVHGIGDLAILKAKNKNKLTLVAFDLFNSANYLKQLKQKGFVLPASTTIDTAYFRAFCELNSSKKLFLSMNFPKSYFSAIVKDIQPIGLTFAYKQSNLSAPEMNYSIFKNHWNALEMTQKQHDGSDALAANYLPALLYAKQYASKEKLSIDATKLESVIQQVANRSNKTQAVKQVQN
jgi:hypothetical protein